MIRPVPEQSALIQVAARLVRGDGLPSDHPDDYHQKTFARSVVVRKAEKSRAWALELGVEVRRLADAVAERIRSLEAEVAELSEMARDEWG